MKVVEPTVQEEDPEAKAKERKRNLLCCVFCLPCFAIETMFFYDKIKENKTVSRKDGFWWVMCMCDVRVKEIRIFYYVYVPCLLCRTSLITKSAPAARESLTKTSDSLSRRRRRLVRRILLRWILVRRTPVRRTSRLSCVSVSV